MSNPDENGEASENALAYAAIELLSNGSHGAVPQWHELAAWQSGSLAQPRSDEVLSHVANNPEYFQQWLDLAEGELWVEGALTLPSASDVDEVAPDSIINPTIADAARKNTDSFKTTLLSRLRPLQRLLKQPLPVYGSAFAAILLAVLVVPLLPTDDVLTMEQRINRSMDTYIETGSGLVGAAPVKSSTRSLGGLFDELSTSDVERQYVQNGMQRFSKQLQSSDAENNLINEAWRPLLSELNAQAPDCNKAIDQTHCAEVAVDYRLLGQWTMMNLAACQGVQSGSQRTLKPDFWSEQYELYGELRALPSISGSVLYASSLPSLAEQTPKALCQNIRAVLSATL